MRKLRPATLERASGPWQARELAGRVVAAVGFGATLAAPFAQMLAAAGAQVCVIGGERAPFREAGEAFGVPVCDAPFSRVLVDATSIDLHELYRMLHPIRIPASGRLVVLASRDPITAAALAGFVRSAAKELGRRGATAQLITIEPGAEARAAAIARFVLSARSAFMTAQPLFATMAVTGDSLDCVNALDRKVALVTGAARGIGAAIARRLAEEGAHVVCVDRDERTLAAVARSIGGSLIVADVAEGIAAQPVDIVVHNAGITRDRTFAKMTAAEWDDVIAVNLDAVVRITEALAVRDGGRIICLSSVSGIAGNVGQTNYAASKAGLLGYVGALAHQLAPRGITVNAIAPGFIETQMTAAMPFAIREVARRLSALGQGGEPRDVAELATFLAQPAAVGITGAVVRICGGAFIGA